MHNSDGYNAYQLTNMLAKLDIDSSILETEITDPTSTASVDIMLD